VRVLDNPTVCINSKRRPKYCDNFMLTLTPPAQTNTPVPTSPTVAPTDTPTMEPPQATTEPPPATTEAPVATDTPQASVTPRPTGGTIYLPMLMRAYDVRAH
jgi:hypothetical protein